MKRLARNGQTEGVGRYDRKSQSMKNTRWAFVVVSLITLVLLVGSAVLQRIVFRAAESQASVFLSPATFIVKPQGEVGLDIVSNFSQEAFVAAAQLVVEFDPKILQFNNAVAASGFVTKKVVSEDGLVSWLLIPSKGQGLVGQYKNVTTLGRLNFLATAQGSTTININPRLSLISAIDPEGRYALYNAIRSTQNAAGEITELSSNSQVTPASSTTKQPNGTIFSTQRIVSSEVIPLANQSLISVGLRYLGSIEVDFGPTEELGNKAVGLVPSTAQLIRLNGLANNANYYYRVRVLDQNQKTVITSPVKTFATVSSGEGAIDAALSDLVAVNHLPVDETAVLAIFRNEKGEIVEADNAEIRVISGEATVAPVAETSPYTANVTTAVGSRQVVVLASYVNDIKISQVEITFDPTRTQQASPEANSSAKLGFDRSVQLTLASLLAVLLLSGLVLVRLLKVH